MNQSLFSCISIQIFYCICCFKRDLVCNLDIIQYVFVVTFKFVYMSIYIYPSYILVYEWLISYKPHLSSQIVSIFYFYQVPLHSFLYSHFLYCIGNSHSWSRCPVDTLQWRHSGHVSVSNYQPHDCLLNCLFRHRSKKTPKPRVTGLCAGKFPAQMASNAENIPIWWRHHLILISYKQIYKYITELQSLYQNINAMPHEHHAVSNSILTPMIMTTSWHRHS